MPSPQEIEAKFWKALKSDMTMMIGLDGVEDGHARPMTAQLGGDRSPIWFFTAKDHALVQRWNRFVAAWFEGGKDDPKLALLRLDAERAEIWVDASSLVAGIKLLLGVDPKKDYKDKVAKVALR